MYLINKKEYELKERYTLKDWGKILRLLASFNKGDVEGSIIILLAEDKIIELLNLILNKQIVGDVYEDDINEVNKVIKDFFLRKSGLTATGSQNLQD